MSRLIYRGLRSTRLLLRGLGGGGVAPTIPVATFVAVARPLARNS